MVENRLAWDAGLEVSHVARVWSDDEALRKLEAAASFRGDSFSDFGF